EMELARLACAPFRPARQPKLWFAGLGLGHALSAALAELKQKRATFIVAEPLEMLREWHSLHLPKSPLHEESRICFEKSCDASSLARHQGSLHAVLIHLDAAPLGRGNQAWTSDPTWLAAAYDALQPGGLLAIAASRPNPGLKRRLYRAGFEVAEHQTPISPHAKKVRLAPIWLARKHHGNSSAH
ncbi:MAG: hypothetical protein ACO3RV_07455, partial [Luteolibacter sp.]